MKVKEVVDLSLLNALFQDAIRWRPDLHLDLANDFDRVARIVGSRGISFLVEEMPEGGKVFDQALSAGVIDPVLLPKTFGEVTGGSRIFLNSLFKKVFDDSGHILENVDEIAVLFIRQILYLAKELDMQCPKEKILKAVHEFHTIEDEMRLPTLSWADDQIGREPKLNFNFQRQELENENILYLFEAYQDQGYEVHGLPSTFSGLDCRTDIMDTPNRSHGFDVPDEVLQRLHQICDLMATSYGSVPYATLWPKHGPGAVSDIRTGEDKYSFPNWPAKLDRCFPIDAYASIGLGNPILEGDQTWVNHEPPAKLIAVPKTPVKPRLIASEPSAHQFCQQALMGWMRGRLPRFLRNSIDFFNQEPSRSAALAASRDGLSATLDLSSASDRLSCWFVERAFRKNPELLEHLHSVRTRWMVDTIATPKRFRKLRKYANQGSAVTFTLQTILYTCAALACLSFERQVPVTRKNLGKLGRDVRVFGDDIIVPADVAGGLVILLSYLGLEVNMRKTHITGRFRESCGMDAFKGVDVTPLKIRYLELGNDTKKLASWVDQSNLAYTRGLWHLADAMTSRIPEKIRKLIPTTNRRLGCLTLLTYTDCLRTTKLRWNESHQVAEVQGFVTRDRTARIKRDSYRNLLQYFVERPSREQNFASGFNGRVRSVLTKRWVRSH